MVEVALKPKKKRHIICYMAKTQTIVIRNQEERVGAITRMTDAGWKLIEEESSMAHEDSTILTFEEENSL
jgi:hypothetical protein